MSERPAPAGARQDGVVLLHGISRTALSFRKMQVALERAGFTTLNLDYASRSKALEALAEDIHPAIHCRTRCKMVGTLRSAHPRDSLFVLPLAPPREIVRHVG